MRSGDVSQGLPFLGCLRHCAEDLLARADEDHAPVAPRTSLVKLRNLVITPLHCSLNILVPRRSLLDQPLLDHVCARNRAQSAPACEPPHNPRHSHVM